MGKSRLNTRRGLAAERRRQAEERKNPKPSRSYRPSGEMDKMLKGIDPDNFERLARGE